MKVVFKHLRDTSNLGDRWCSPYDHMPKLRENWDSVALDLGTPTPTCDAVIYGGGKISGGLAATLGPGDLNARARIAWGVSTVQKFWFAPRYWKMHRRMSLIGSRDWGDTRFDFVPCASCMAPTFDKLPAPEHDVVVYLHHWRAPRMGFKVPDGIPVMDNTHGSFAETIAFIASGRTVVSNSYHGTYWGLLLGRKVLCVPFSNKFNAFRIAPGYARPQTWQDELAKARGSDELLGICREATGKFARKVQDLVSAS